MTFKSFITSIIFASATCFAAFADKDPEEYHVQVVLENGDTITGYIHYDLKTGLKNMFSKGGRTLRQYINIGTEAKGGEKKRYNASEVKEYRFLEATEGYPEGAVCVSEMINFPKLFKPISFMRGFVWELNRRNSGSILKWEVWESTGGRNSVSRLVPVIGIKLKDAPAAFIIVSNGSFNDWYLMYYLKKNNPELHEAWQQYYHKGKDAKAHRKELLDNPSTALLFYENYLGNSEVPLRENEKED